MPLFLTAIFEWIASWSLRTWLVAALAGLGAFFMARPDKAIDTLTWFLDHVADFLPTWNPISVPDFSAINTVLREVKYFIPVDYGMGLITSFIGFTAIFFAYRLIVGRMKI